jgi:hypothetical protein
VNSYEYRLADQSCCGVGFMAPDLLSAPDKVALPGLSMAFPFGEPLLLPIKTVLVDLFRYCRSERAAFRNSRKSLRCVLGTRRYLPIMFLESQLGISLHPCPAQYLLYTTAYFLA